MRRTHGFTLLEILIVLVIAASVLAFALPAYKRTQDRNAYLAATGVLSDLGAAVQVFRQDLALYGGGFNHFPNNNILFNPDPYEYPFTYVPSACADDHNTISTARNSAERICTMFAQGYIQPIAWDDPATGSSFKNYEFFVCRESNGSGSCKKDTIAVMKTKDGVTRASGGTYYGARMSKTGEIEQLSN